MTLVRTPTPNGIDLKVVMQMLAQSWHSNQSPQGNAEKNEYIPPDVGAIEAISAIAKIAAPKPKNVTIYIQTIPASPPLIKT
jgi:hypothetical protein